MLATLNTRSLPIAALIAVKFAVCVTKWATRRRTRAALRQLESWQLRDVGLTRDKAITEASRVFWKA
tara:strand:- start:1849 stop:2049 length:201 start_codon:yes stop_codon:yes gene_type:complete